MIIDIHNHPDWYGYTVNKFIANMDQYGIDKTCLLSWEAPRIEWNPKTVAVFPDTDERGPVSFNRCVAFKEKAPDRFLLGYAPDPRDPDAITKLKFAKSAYDINVYGELKLRVMYDDRDAIALYKVCGQMGLPVLVHIDYEIPCKPEYPRANYWYGGGNEAFARAIAECKDTIFIGHAPGFWARISGDDLYDKVSYPKEKVQPGGMLISMLDQYQNLWCDLSGGSGWNALARDPEFAVGFLTKYQDRILYGRDQFDNKQQEFLNGAGLPAEVLEKIYHKNAERLLKL
jgi:predicted TIM-barrel fold metal-dependent hydrolase